jgi:uncharacterized membrane protein YdcZ (DUF606 family)
LDPFLARLVQSVKNPGFEALQNHAVGTFYMAIGLWVCDGHPIHADIVVITKLQEFLAGELGAIVDNDGVEQSKPVDDVSEERRSLFT